MLVVEVILAIVVDHAVRVVVPSTPRRHVELIAVGLCIVIRRLVRDAIATTYPAERVPVDFVHLRPSGRLNGNVPPCQPEMSQRISGRPVRRPLPGKHHLEVLNERVAIEDIECERLPGIGDRHKQMRAVHGHGDR